jgi:hypothetical protein
MWPSVVRASGMPRPAKPARQGKYARILGREIVGRHGDARTHGRGSRAGMLRKQASPEKQAAADHGTR